VSSEPGLPARRWRPGEPGNPRGRPRGFRALREVLAGNVAVYAQELHELALGRGRHKFEALKLALHYVCGPPSSPAYAERSVHC
jgi:hypothetical protein